MMKEGRKTDVKNGIKVTIYSKRQKEVFKC